MAPLTMTSAGMPISRMINVEGDVEEVEEVLELSLVEVAVEVLVAAVVAVALVETANPVMLDAVFVLCDHPD